MMNLKPDVKQPMKDLASPSSDQIDRTLGLLWMMYIVSSCVFVGLGYWVLKIRDSLDLPPSPANLVVVGVLAVIISELAVRIARAAVATQDARKRLTLSLIALSFAETIAIGGIVAAWLLHSSYPLILLAGVSLVLFFRLAKALR